MKEKAKRIEHKFKMPHLFLDDLETIENTIKKEFPQSKYKLETEELEFENLSEIPKNLSMTRNFYISVKNDSDLNVYFHQCCADISATYYDDAKTFGLFNKIVEIISKRERKLLYWWSELNPFMVGLLFISAQISVELLVHKKQKNAIFGCLAIAIVFLAFICCWFVGYYIHTRKFSIIEFVHKKEKPNFFKRNKDSIIIVIIGAILGSLFTLIAEFIIKLF